ncbi:MAG: lysine--tRNA ligase, partial [Segetibacter sp.]|nr:lysine--tRNA ligase [Segetibacter sp.]
MNSPHLSEQEIIRREKLEELKKLGIDPYPAALYPVTHHSTEIKNVFTDDNKDEWNDVCLAGRIMSIRDMGKAAFAELQDSQGRIQIYVRKDDLTNEGNTTLYDVVWKKLLDIGDIIGVKGFVFRTKMGEISIHVKEFTLLSKSLRPLPIVKEAEGQTFDSVTDPEFKYRQRYADLVINPSIKETFIKRTKLINSIREFLNSHGALEVDTPVLQTIPGGAAARPFRTHHNALDVPFYLRIANELYLKRL